MIVGNSMKQSGNSRRIVKNTVFLYIRMLLLMLITLYTTRIVLRVLGEADFGIYNLIGGIVIMMAFFNGALSSTTNRYIAFELGKEQVFENRRILYFRHSCCSDCPDCQDVFSFHSCFGLRDCHRNFALSAAVYRDFSADLRNIQKTFPAFSGCHLRRTHINRL